MLITVDSGRHGVKAICNGQRLFFPAVVSPAHDFNLDVDLDNPNYYHVTYEGKEYFIGDLAIKQSEFGMQDRTRDKSNINNRLLIINAISMFAEQNETVTLLTNVPARDWKSQKGKIEESLRGAYRIQHKAGSRKGIYNWFGVDQVFALPEGAGAFFGYVFDDNLQVIRDREGYLEGMSLVLEIGDETINYIVMEDGEYIDNLCGSLDLGLHIAHAEVQKWLEGSGVEITQAKLTNYILNDKKAYSGNKEFNVKVKAYEEYAKLARRVYGQLSGKLSFNKFRKVLLAGGGCFELYGEFKNLLPFAPDCPVEGEGQWLNAKGFGIMYKMMQEN
jgi:plasmid segregation protein ParM